jgi:glycosyltransferase involved in cell wall biosynthesis
MATTVLIEPDPGGHRFQAVAHVASVASRTDDILLLTSVGASSDPAFSEFLGGTRLRVEEVFDAIYPPTRAMARAAAQACRTADVSTVVVMDADQSLKRWWYVAPREFRSVRRPRIVFFVTRYPARLQLNDWFSWKLRLSKASLALAAMATRSLHRAAGFAGRDEMAPGWIIKRTRDPEICSAHSRDRASLREELRLPHDRTIAGIFGVISDRKNAPLIWEAMDRGDIDGDLLLAGRLTDDVRTWVASLPPTQRGSILVRDGFLSNEVLDKLVAAVDVVPLALTLNGPSGIMGKALAAEVPVVAAGSEVMAREVVATDAGEVADLDADSIAEAILRALARDPSTPRRNTVPPATADEFAEKLLGVDATGRVLRRNLR